MISWVKPEILIPVHGEPLHLHEHAKLARKAGVPKVIECRNGVLVKLGPGDASIIGEVPHGRLYKDGLIVETEKARSVAERRKLGFAGAVFVALAITDKGELVDDPQVELVGVPELDTEGREIDDRVYEMVIATFNSLPRGRRRDADALAESIRRAARSEVNAAWGKKPICHVHVLMV